MPGPHLPRPADLLGQPIWEQDGWHRSKSSSVCRHVLTEFAKCFIVLQKPTSNVWSHVPLDENSMKSGLPKNQV